jgi:N-acetylglucosamine-6-phosphate deacetylase
MRSAPSFCVENAILAMPGVGLIAGGIRVVGERIAALGPGVRAAESDERVDAQGRLLSAGLIDVHTHGLQRFRYEAGAEELRQAAATLTAYGCTCAYPTLIGKSEGAFLELLSETCGALSGVSGVCLPGVHVEGPFLAFTGAGCTIIPGDLGLLREILAAGGGRVAAMSISPDVTHIIPVIEALVAADVRVFITHTGATLAQTQRAIDAGAHHATHFYDVFYPQPETDLGVRPVACVEAILADRRVTVDFIADGVHVEPTAVRLGLCAKGWEKVILITDSNVGAGMPPGEYDTPWGFRIYAHPDRAARIIGEHKFAGALAGSALTMNRGMANLLAWFAQDVPAECVWAMGTANPARLMGLSGKGVLRVGADADLVLWQGATLVPRRTWVAGVCVYTMEGVD